MDKYSVVADVLGIIICCIILYGTLFETKSKDKRRISLVYTILFAMVQSGVNILYCLNKTDSNSYWFIASIYIVTGPGSLIGATFFMNYMRYILESYGVDIAKKAKAFAIYAYISSGIVIAIVALKLIFYLDNGEVLFLPGIHVFGSLLVAGVVFYFVIVFSIMKRVSKRIFFILIGYIFLPIIISVILAIFFPKYILGFAVKDITLVLLYVMLQSNIQDSSEQEKLEYFRSMSGIYHTLYVIDFDKKTFFEFGAAKFIHEYVNKHKELGVQEIIWGVMEKSICEAHREAIKKFVDFSTLEERMKGTNMINIELITVDKRWFSFSFIRIGKEKDGLKKAFFTSLDIDDIKRKEDKLILMSNTDQLTHLYNRNAYETYLKEVEAEGVPDDLIYVSCDLNGLKIVNDTLGHDAGDELIIQMAECLTESFASYGKVYRIGGDEFIIILQATLEEYKEMLAKLKKLQTNWHGSFADELSSSIGMVSAKEVVGGSIVDMHKIADERMYECKREYYQLKGINRQGHKIDV